VVVGGQAPKRLESGDAEALKMAKKARALLFFFFFFFFG
jgi:hypothetical protein